MDLRSDLIPPVLALTLSLVAHGAIFRWQPPLPLPDESPPETVELRYLPAPEAGPVTPEQPSAPPPKMTGAPPVPEPAPKPVPSAPVPPTEPEPMPRARAPDPPPAPTPSPPPLAIPTPEPAPRQVPSRKVSAPLPDLAQLLPRKSDLAAAQGVGVPDPTAEDALEATLQIGAQDIRYRGYLGRVRGAVDLSWRWREALLAAGSPGSVVIRFTLIREGGVDEVTIVTSSGNPILDREATDTVRRANLPAFPPSWKIERLNLTAQFDYRFE